MNFRLKIFVLCALLSCIVADRVHNIKKRSYKNQKKFPTPVALEDKNYWDTKGSDELNDALNQAKLNTNKAKNVIIFLGDGMGFQTIMAARVYKGQESGVSGEEGHLNFETFPHVGISKVYNLDSQVPDSAGTGTAYLCGVKTNIGIIGFDTHIIKDNCSSMNPDHYVYSIAKWFQDSGKRSGVITTTRVTHATPSGLYAHTAGRDWEVDANLPEGYEVDCPTLKDIAKQLVEDSPGNKLNVVMGGGFQVLDPDPVVTKDDPLSDYIGVRQDGRHLLDEWLQTKQDDGKKASVIRTRSDLLNYDLNATDYVMGIFANDHMPYAHLRRENNLDIPSLAEMTESAIDVLDNGDEGFFLLVEGGKIDWAHHAGQSKTALDETIDFDDAVQRALEMVNLEETLIIVTADHTHTMSVSGYPSRGSAISGIADTGDDDVPYTTMLYGSGPGYNYSVENGKVVRLDPSTVDPDSFEFVHQAATYKEYAAHGGDDVPIYAIGPWSHLFYKTHEQNYIAHVMAFASCTGQYVEPCLSLKKTRT